MWPLAMTAGGELEFRRGRGLSAVAMVGENEGGERYLGMASVGAGVTSRLSETRPTYIWQLSKI